LSIRISSTGWERVEQRPKKRVSKRRGVVEEREEGSLRLLEDFAGARFISEKGCEGEGEKRIRRRERRELLRPQGSGSGKELT